MTEFELRLKYHFDTGHYPEYDMQAYLKWVEELLVQAIKRLYKLTTTQS
jgi:hypothetical protein